MAHVLFCPHHKCSLAWTHQMDHIQLWMEQSHTAPSIQQCLLHTLQAHRTHTFVSHANLLCLHTACNQDHIGLFGLLVGHLANTWTSIQEQYYSSINCQCSAALWTVQLCHQLLQMSHNLWLDCNHHILAQRQLTASSAIHLKHNSN